MAKMHTAPKKCNIYAKFAMSTTSDMSWSGTKNPDHSDESNNDRF